MKAGLLVKYLNRYPEDTDVFIPGYEGGINSINTTKRVYVKLYENTEWYYGQHETDAPDKSDCHGILLSYDAKLFCNNIHRKYPKLALLNAEGDIFRLYRLPAGKFILEDQYKALCGKYDLFQLQLFLNGTRDLTDSEGATWNYANCDVGMKPKQEMLDEFLGISIGFDFKCKQVAERFRSLSYKHGDDSDIGNEVGELLSSLDPNFDIESFIAGLKHGVSLNNGTH
jgi:hypothetical protein